MRALFNITTPPYLMEILYNYFQNRKVVYLTDEGEQEYIVYGLCTWTTTIEHYL